MHTPMKRVCPIGLSYKTWSFTKVRITVLLLSFTKITKGGLFLCLSLKMLDLCSYPRHSIWIRLNIHRPSYCARNRESPRFGYLIHYAGRVTFT